MTNRNLRSTYITSLTHFILFVLLPLTSEQTTEKIFWKVHETTLVKWLSALLLSFAVMAAIIAMFALAGKALRLLRIKRIGNVITIIPALLYAGLIHGKWLENKEFAVAVGSLFFCCLALFAYSRKDGSYSSLKSLVPMSLAASSALLVLSSAISLPLLKWSNDQKINAAIRASSPNLVWIIFDELAINGLVNREGEIDQVNYPGFHDLAARSTWYANTITPHTWTELAVPGQLNGKMSSDTTQLPSSWTSNLPTGILQYGFSDVGFPFFAADNEKDSGEYSAKSFRVLIEDSAILIGHKILPKFLRQMIPSLGNSWGNFRTPSNRVSGLESWMKSFDMALGSDTPVVTVAHSLIAHHNWTLDGLEASFINNSIPYSEDHYMPGTCDILGPELLCVTDLMLLNKRLYGMNAKAADQALSQVIELLHRHNQFDNTMIVVTSDHGVGHAVGMDGRRIPPDDNHFDDLVRVPLFVKILGQKDANIVTETRSTTQILATVLQELKLLSPPEIDPPLTETLQSFTVNNVPHSGSFAEISTWLNDGGSLVEAENGKYPYAIGPLATLVGNRTDSIGRALSEIAIENLLVDRFRETASKSDSQYRHLVSGKMSRDDCQTGLLALIENNHIVGTMHRYPSFKDSKKDGLWGVAQSDAPIGELSVLCVSA
jgi:hypothetical protein